MSMKLFKHACLAGMACFSALVSGQNYTTPFNHCLLPEAYYDQLVGESSGDRAFNYIMDIAPYERDRQHADYQGHFMESEYVVNQLKRFGIANATIEGMGQRQGDGSGGQAALYQEIWYDQAVPSHVPLLGC